jgi:catechol 2,3-dioxygenase-like lactoylglutathione lyase family enzyme
MTATAITTGAPSEDRTKLEAVRALRRRRNKVRRLHHHAVRTDDMEVTRRFYEDLLGLPMVKASRETTDIGGREAPFLHCLFEMGDGSCLAFFEFLPDAFGPARTLPPNGIDHHFAMSVAHFIEIAELKAKFDALRHPNCGINHGFCYSLYVRDPNGMLVEFVSEPANELEINEAAAAKAHGELAKWRRHDYGAIGGERPLVTYPLPSSPPEEIARVILRGA